MNRYLQSHIFLIFISLPYFNSAFCQTGLYDLNLSVTNIRNANGKIQVQIYKDQAAYDKETPWKQYRFEKTNLEGEVLRFRITDIPGGTYGIALLDDEDGDGKMKYRLMVPREGFGFFGYYPGKNKKPTFDDFKFQLKTDTTMEAKVRYIL